MKKTPVLAAVVLLSTVLMSCSSSTTKAPDITFEALRGAPANYLLSTAGRLPANFPDIVAANGDSLGAFHADAGFAAVTTSRPDAYNRYASIVVEDVFFRLKSPEYSAVAFEADIADPPTSGDDDELFDLQWGHAAVRAQEAWEAGQTGEGVRVAVLDSGFDLDHPDLAPNINVGLSKSFVITEELEYGLDDVYSHGTHVAGTIAAANNGTGTIGVAPDAELVLVKVLGDAGNGSFGDVIAGILYAAEVDADVINMSLGTIIFQGNGHPDPEGEEAHARDVAALRVAVNRAIAYANRLGSTVVVAAGNEALDLNAPENASLVPFNSFASHAISVSALGPLGWALDPATNLDEKAIYTNIGPEIDFSAPGGNIDFALYLVDADGEFDPVASPPCELAGILSYCYAFDLVFSTGNDGYYWSAGTSMAAPHASGVAALIIGEHGGEMKPSLVRQKLRQRAEDLGTRGNDELHGYGRVTSGY